MSNAIPFVVPADFRTAYESGAVQQIGALLKDTATGKIVAHMQETGAMQRIASHLVDLNPVSGVVQMGLDAANTALAVRADRKLTELASMVGSLQTVQIVTAASSIAGLGVTVASTMVILNRLRGISKGLQEITAKLDALPQTWREIDLQKTLGDVQTQLERMEEIGARKAAKPVIQKAEEKLHDAFNRLHHGTMTVVAEVSVDADLLRQLMAGLALSGGAQIRALYELNEVETAGRRAHNQFEKLQTLSMQIPRDSLARKLVSDSEPDEAFRLADILSQIRLNTASQPSLAERLSSLEVSGPDYLARVRDEEEEPVLLLPTTS